MAWEMFRLGGLGSVVRGHFKTYNQLSPTGGPKNTDHSISIYFCWLPSQATSRIVFLRVYFLRRLVVVHLTIFAPWAAFADQDLPVDMADDQPMITCCYSWRELYLQLASLWQYADSRALIFLLAEWERASSASVSSPYLESYFFLGGSTLDFLFPFFLAIAVRLRSLLF